MKIIDYFKAKKELKKTIAQENEFVKDLYYATELSANFNIKINYIVKRGKDLQETITKVLESHNFEICFVPTIWKVLNRSEKIACMMELSKKYCKTPFTYQSFVYDKDRDFVDFNDNGVIFNCYVMDENSPLDIMFKIMDIDNEIEHYTMLSKIQNYKSINDFKNFEEIKYYISIFVDHVPKKYHLSVLFASPMDVTSKQCKEEILNIFCNVKFFNKEFEPFYNNLNEQITRLNIIEDGIIKDTLGNTKEKQDEQILKIFYDIAKNKFKDCNYQALKQKFLTNQKEYVM